MTVNTEKQAKKTTRWQGENAMNKINKRLEELEARVAPPGKTVLIVKHKDESDAEAMIREGITQKDLEEATRVLWVRVV